MSQCCQTTRPHLFPPKRTGPTKLESNLEWVRRVEEDVALDGAFIRSFHLMPILDKTPKLQELELARRGQKRLEAGWLGMA